LWVVICLGGLALEIGLWFGLSAIEADKRFGAWVIVPCLLPFIGAVVFGWWLLRRLNRQRIARVAARLRPLGFEIEERPVANGNAAGFFAPLESILSPFALRLGSAGIAWFAGQSASAGPVRCRLFEHEFTTGSGKTTQVHQHTIIAWPAGHGDLAGSDVAARPWFFMGRFPWLKRRVMRKHELDDPALVDLAKVWSLQGDGATGRHFLTPSVRARLAESPRGEQWSIGHGWVIAAFDGTLDKRAIERMLTHCRSVIAASGLAS
jgi:hypothetical protein